MQVETAPVIQVRSRPRYFYLGMTILAAALIVIGFARSYYLKAFFGTPSLSIILHIHGIVMTAWLALLITQSTLVAVRRVDIHRKLGMFGSVLAVLIFIVGVIAAIEAARAGRAPVGLPPLPFLIIPIGDILIFAALVGAALYYRRRPELHKRLMLVATVALLPPGIARWPIAGMGTPLVFFGLTDLILLGCIIYDYAKTRRLSPAFLWAGLLLIASHPLRLMLADTPAWLRIAHWLTGV